METTVPRRLLRNIGAHEVIMVYLDLIARFGVQDSKADPQQKRPYSDDLVVDRRFERGCHKLGLPRLMLFVRLISSQSEKHEGHGILKGFLAWRTFS